MIDAEIAKALERCNGLAPTDEVDCALCPFCDYDAHTKCTEELAKNVLDLINRQKAEIERLKEAYAVYEETTGLKWARAEAIKEFADRLKEKRGHDFPFTRTVFVEDIDDLVKEMTGRN